MSANLLKVLKSALSVYDTHVAEMERTSRFLAERAELVAAIKEMEPAPCTYSGQPPEYQAVIDRMMTEVLADIKSGQVPATVASFSQLHDHVDANEYGGACEPDAEFPYGEPPDADGPRDEKYVETVCAFWNRCQTAIDDWIKAGMPK